MEEVNITEVEARYFMDLFMCCDIEKTGKVPILKATEMFRSADIPNDVLKHIMSLAGIPLTALHMSKVQFYSCLKLIAAHQSSVPLRQELIASTITLPLPKFSWKESPVLNQVNSLDTNMLNGTIDNLNQWRSNASHSPNLIELARIESSHSDIANSDITSTDSEVEHNDSDAKGNSRRCQSPEAWSTASDSPTPTNSVAERPWAKNPMWQCEEQRQLLATEEESSDRHSSEEDTDADIETVYQIMPEQREYYIKQFRTIQPDLNGLISGHAAKVFFEKSRIPVEELRHIWQLCDVTKDGALSLPEFAAAMHLVVLRRNNIPLPPILPPCLIPNSKLLDVAQPAEADLLHLDDDKPADTITTIASDTKTSLTDSASYNNNNNNNNINNNNNSFKSRHTGNSPTSVSSMTNVQTNNNHNKTNSETSPNENSVSSPKQGIPPVTKDWINQTSKEWTKFTESPTSNVSSPGPKPANFDMQRTAQAVVSDPQILHPVPLRITPVGAEGGDEETIRLTQQRKTDSLHYDGGVITIRDSEVSSPKEKQQQNVQNRDSGLQNDLRAIQRPQPKKIQVKNNIGIGAIPPPPQRESLNAATNNNNNDTTDSSLNTTVPPPPPPRPHKHARSSSLDLNKLKLSAPEPPEVPPRVSPQMTAQISLDAHLETVNSTFADFTQFPESIVEAPKTTETEPEENSMPIPPRPSLQSFQSSQRSSAFEVYRKPTPRESVSPPEQAISKQSSIDNYDNSKRSSLINDHARHNVPFKQEKNLTDVMRHLHEQNILLTTLCNDLSDELLTIQQKKEELRVKIDCDGHNSGNNNGNGLINNSNNNKDIGNQSTV